MDYTLMGDQIRKHRKRLNLSQGEVAEMIDVSTSFVGHIERGTRKASMETIVKICQALRVSAEEIFPPQPAGFLERGYTPDQLRKATKLLEMAIRIAENEVVQLKYLD